MVLLAIAIPTPAQEYLDLPEIGDPTATVLPLSKEKKLRDVFIRELRSKLPIETDIELNEYITSLGTQLTSAHPHIQLKFNFLLINNPQINAFATIGGIISVNSGLVFAAQHESQVAGVLAHEITHVTQRHIARMLAAISRFKWTNILAILSVIVAATYDSDLGQLGLYSSAALPLDQRLQYSREHEHEADRIGIRLMARAGIKPSGMVEFFQIMQNFGGPSQIPEFLRTHPLTNSRIANAANQVARLRGNYRNDSREFQFFKARFEGLANPKKAILSVPHNSLGIYRKAIALTQRFQPQEAIRLLGTLDKNSLPIQLALAQARIAHGDYQNAAILLKRLNGLYHNRDTVSYYYAQALLKQKKPNQALAVLQPIADKKEHYPIIDKLLAEIFAAQNKPWLSYEYLSDYYSATGNLPAASKQLKKALNQNRGGRAFQERVKDKNKQLEELKKLIKDPFK